MDRASSVIGCLLIQTQATANHSALPDLSQYNFGKGIFTSEWIEFHVVFINSSLKRCYLNVRYFGCIY